MMLSYHDLIFSQYYFVGCKLLGVRTVKSFRLRDSKGKHCYWEKFKAVSLFMTRRKNRHGWEEEGKGIDEEEKHTVK